MFKVTRTSFKTPERCPKLTIKIPERRHWRCSVVNPVQIQYS